MKKRLLIVDDEPELAFLVRDRAQFYNLECEIELTGDECIAKAKAFKPNLILLDMNLPKISGFGIMRELKDHPELSQIPIIILSALSQEEVIREALNMGAKAYFVKTGNMLDLFHLIREYI